MLDDDGDVKTFDVNNKSMVRVEDYDRITVVNNLRLRTRGEYYKVPATRHHPLEFTPVIRKSQGSQK